MVQLCNSNSIMNKEGGMEKEEIKDNLDEMEGAASRRQKMVRRR